MSKKYRQTKQQSLTVFFFLLNCLPLETITITLEDNLSSGDDGEWPWTAEKMNYSVGIHDLHNLGRDIIRKHEIRIVDESNGWRR
jgi:hypothetical protein